MFKLLLFVHVVSVVVAFGPTYTFPMISAMARKDPKYAPFAAQVMEVISMRFTLPFVLVAGVAGVLMIFKLSIPIFEEPWLLIAIVLYVAAVTFSVLVQEPNTKKMVKLTKAMAGAGPPPEGAPPGPPPEIAALGKRLQMGGTMLGVFTLVMFYLMIFRPGGNF